MKKLPQQEDGKDNDIMISLPIRASLFLSCLSQVPFPKLPVNIRMKRYRLYIDESGDHTFGKLEDVGRQYLCLLGMFIDQEMYRSSFYPALEKLKQNHFPHNPDEPLILHRSDIINKRGAFGRLADPEKEFLFNTDLLNFLANEDYKIIGVVIDKNRM
jgi:hypothetical protein